VDKPPVPSAGPSQTVNEGALVLLTAAASTDPDGDPLSFAWTQIAGPAANLVNANTVSPVFIAPNVPVTGATLTFSVAVTAASVTRSATVDIIVNDVTNSPPTVLAGANQSVDERTLGQLHAVANDPDGDPLTVTWTQLSPASPVIVLSSASDLSPTFTAPEVAADTDFTFQITVSDGAFSASATTTVTVKDVNQAPIAIASAPVLADERSSITLDGSQSFDPDGQDLTYSWTVVGSLPSGASLVNADQALATFNTGDVDSDTQAVFNLVVNDGLADSNVASVTVTVRNLNRAPIAVANGPATAKSRDLVTLDGSLSSDPDGDAITYQWTQTAGPNVVINGASTASPTFLAPEVGASPTTAVTFSLTVSDGSTLSTPATVSIAISKANRGPHADAGVNLTAEERTTVHLSALASTDPDGDALTFAWKQLAPDPSAGTSVAFDDATSPTPSFVVPAVPSDVDFLFQVTATDTSGATGVAQVTVSAKHVNGLPTLTGGTVAEASAGATVTLDGGTAADPDNDTITYAWTQISGPTVTLVGATTAHPTFTAPKVTTATLLGFDATISDGHGGSAVNRVFVTVDAPASSSGGCSSSGGTSSFGALFALVGVLALRRRKTTLA
jgi:uncharacterized protein (TIGR03382 family)